MHFNFQYGANNFILKKCTKGGILKETVVISNAFSLVQKYIQEIQISMNEIASYKIPLTLNWLEDVQII